jgi:endonuclease YncB( thermonuclease family)
MSRIRSRLGRVAVGLAVALGALAGTTVGSADAAQLTRTRARVTSWVDGDTVRTTKGTVRLIGMDTPERGRECYWQATRSAKRLAPVGSRITLVRVLGRDNTDRYGRKLRYVQNVWNKDVGHKQIIRGLADARYDGQDGYGSHPRQRAYRTADARYRDRDCTPTPPPPPPPTGNCHPAYPDFCIPPPPPDLDCGDIRREFTVNHAYGDPHGFDGEDNDGRGCESYG